MKELLYTIKINSKYHTAREFTFKNKKYHSKIPQLIFEALEQFFKKLQ